jgi:sugar phosphate isomerase/epimerase
MQCNASPEMPGLLAPQISDEELADLKLMLDSFNLGVASFNGDGDFTVSEKMDEQIASVRQRIAIAGKLKAKILIMFAGWHKRTDDAVYQQISSGLTEVCKIAGDNGMTVALENHGGVTATIEQCNRILGGVQADNIGLNYDPANFLMYEQDPLEALQKMAYPIVFTHFKSLKINAAGKKEYCRVKDGVIEYRPILKKLSKMGYDGFYGLEYEKSEDVFEGTSDDFKYIEGIIENENI